MFRKLRDSLDTDVCMIILLDHIDELTVLAEVVVSIGKERLHYEVYKGDLIVPYMMELRMPYNRYLKMMKGLNKRGYTLRPESTADVFNRMIKL